MLARFCHGLAVQGRDTLSARQRTAQQAMGRHRQISLSSWRLTHFRLPWALGKDKHDECPNFNWTLELWPCNHWQFDLGRGSRARIQCGLIDEHSDSFATHTPGNIDISARGKISLFACYQDKCRAICTWWAIYDQTRSTTTIQTADSSIPGIPN